MDRRSIMLGLGALLAAPRAARAAPDLAALAAAAAGEQGELSWYESNPIAALDRVVAAFNRGPGARIRVRPESVPGGVGIVGRVANEAQAGGGRTADVVSLGGSGIARLQERGLLAPVDWAGLGLPAAWVAGPALLTAASIYCVIYNRNQVSAADAPRTWDDLLNPRWRGRIGTWVRAAAFAELAEAWGEDRTTAYYTRFLEQNPMLFRSTAPLAQQVAAGEIAIGLGVYHTALPAIRRGAPIEVVMLDPTPISAIWTAAVTRARRPEAAKLLGVWLATPDGARAYEQATERGHPLMPETETGRRLQGLRLAEWPMAQKDVYARIYEAFNARVNEAQAR
ncbi:ABC transporter substrate-binding protein [Falsiroseomonas oryzae]|uniref:ABC transporter substrate-binding protein n=1 Tax=Falsiroseomonas oryzae TaxID=2766473 RepID=UPI0022EB2731|nr:extracellular solute-binding protein [Roseomonas sp. MO-31]